MKEVHVISQSGLICGIFSNMLAAYKFIKDRTKHDKSTQLKSYEQYTRDFEHTHVHLVFSWGAPPIKWEKMRVFSKFEDIAPNVNGSAGVQPVG